MKYFIKKAVKRQCPNCGRVERTEEGRDFDCPKCRKSFCDKCFVSDPDGPGDYILCPHCKTKLFFGRGFF